MDAKDNLKRTTLRLPQDLYDRIESSVGVGSLNAIIVATLEAAFPQPPLEIKEILDELTDLQIALSDPEGIEAESLRDDIDNIAISVMALDTLFNKSK